MVKAQLEVRPKPTLSGYSWNDSSSSSSEGDSPKSQTSYSRARNTCKHNTMYGSTGLRSNIPRSCYVVYKGRSESRGILQLAISAQDNRVTVTILQLQNLPVDFIRRASILIRVSVASGNKNNLRFRTRSVPVTSQSVTFHETITVELPYDVIYQRLLITACLKHDDVMFPDKLGWMSFGIGRLLEAEKVIDGWYCLLDKATGKRKHLSLKDHWSIERETNVLQSSPERRSNQSAVLRRQSCHYGYANEFDEPGHQKMRSSSIRRGNSRSDSRAKAEGGFGISSKPTSGLDMHMTPAKRNISPIRSPKAVATYVSPKYSKVQKGRRRKTIISPIRTHGISPRDVAKESIGQKAGHLIPQDEDYVFLTESRVKSRTAKLSKLGSEPAECALNKQNSATSLRHWRSISFSDNLSSRSEAKVATSKSFSSSSSLQKPFSHDSAKPEFVEENDQSKIINSHFRTSSRWKKRRSSFFRRGSFRRPLPRTQTPGRSSLVSLRSASSYENQPSEKVHQAESMLSLSNPPPCVFATSRTSLKEWEEMENTTRVSPCKMASNSRGLKIRQSFLDVILEPLKSTKKAEKKNLNPTVPMTSSVMEEYVIIGKNGRSQTPRTGKKSKGASKCKLGTIFQSREGYGSTASLCTPELYFSQRERNSKFSRVGALRQSKRKKFDNEVLATPMNSRRRPGRFSLGEYATPSQRKPSFSNRKSNASDETDVLKSALPELKSGFMDATEFFSDTKESDDSHNAKTRPAWRNWLTKKSTTRTKRKAESTENAKIRRTGSMQDVSLMSILTQKDGSIEAFRTFLKLEFSEENLDFWLEVDQYKHLKKFEKPALKIYNTYIADQALREINIESMVKDQIERNIKNPGSSIFDEAQDHIFNLMEKDPYRRFLSKRKEPTFGLSKR